MDINNLSTEMIGVALVAAICISLVLATNTKAAETPSHLQKRTSMLEQATDLGCDAKWIAGGE